MFLSEPRADGPTLMGRGWKGRKSAFKLPGKFCSAVWKLCYALLQTEKYEPSERHPQPLLGDAGLFECVCVCVSVCVCVCLKVKMLCTGRDTGTLRRLFPACRLCVDSS